MCRLTFCALGAVYLLVLVQAYKEGPPVDMYGANLCQSMFPSGHCASTGESGEMSDSHEDEDSHSHEEGEKSLGCYGNQTTMAEASDAAIPFDIIAPTCYKADTDIYVKIKVKTAMADDYYFEGIFVQARLVDDDTNSYGTFSTSDKELQTLNCFSKTANALGQSDADHYDCKNFKWMAPADFDTTIEFVATIVKGESTFWVGVKSAPLTYSADCNVTTTASDACTEEDTLGPSLYVRICRLQTADSDVERRSQRRKSSVVGPGSETRLEIASGAGQTLPVGIVMATLSAILVFIRL